MKRRRPKVHSYRIDTDHRTCTATFRDEPERTALKLRFTHYGDYGDLQEIADWLWPLIQKHDRPGVPFTMDNPLTGQVATVSDPGVVFIRQCQA